MRILLILYIKIYTEGFDILSNPSGKSVTKILYNYHIENRPVLIHVRKYRFNELFYARRDMG
mgnify:CR=1 FL=1